MLIKFDYTNRSGTEMKKKKKIFWGWKRSKFQQDNDKIGLLGAQNHSLSLIFYAFNFKGVYLRILLGKNFWNLFRTPFFYPLS